jgi:hypothetical protein
MLVVAATKYRNAHGDDNRTSWSVHKTEDGLIITCVATRIRSRTWAARVSGPGVEVSMTTPSLEDARTYLLDSFHVMFPQHHCTERCESYGMAELFRVAISGGAS